MRGTRISRLTLTR